MAEITAALVKKLREMTGAGMMDCKKALTETSGDLEGAVDWLRKKGLAAAAKKAGRVAAKGLVGVAIDGKRGAMVEVNSETDFVARNDKFQAFVDSCAKLALETNGDLDSLNAAAYPGSGRTVAEELTQLIAVIGENLQLRRTAHFFVPQGVVGAYVHSKLTDSLGEMGVLVALEHGGGDKLDKLSKELAMHVAASVPQAVDQGDVDPSMVNREREILAEQARASGKAEEIIAKMVEGRLRKYYEEVCLLDQTFVIDGENRVRKVLEQAGKEIGGTVEVQGFARFKVGEGVEGD